MTLWGLDRRIVLLMAGIMGVSVAYVLLLSVAATITVQVQGDLASHWQTSYDLLVRAPGHRLPEETRWEMARINYLINIPPSITTAQYQTIGEIPGVAVAAPVSMVGYFYDRASHYWDRPSPGLYRLHWQSKLDTGLQVLSRTDSLYVWTYDPRQPPIVSPTMVIGEPPWMVVEPDSPLYDSPLYTKLTFPVLLAGVDPAAESALVGLDQAILEGEMLTADWPYCRYPPLQNRTKAALPPGSDHASVLLIPVLARSHLPQALETDLTVASVALPPGQDLLADVMEEGTPALEALPTTDIATFHLDLDTAYRERLLYWQREGNQVRRWVAQGYCRPQLPAEASQEMVQAMESELHPWGIGTALWPLPSPVQYQKGTLADSLAAVPIVAPVAPYSTLNPFDEQLYRAPAKEIVARVSPLIVGTFDESRLNVLSQALIQVPLETYYPVQAVARYDGQGNRLPQPLSLSPGMTPLGYLQSPPAMLTTLEAACAIVGEPCISAVRVRVEGCEKFTPQSQARLESVAAEIVRRTGLEVDIVTGSSPGPVLVQLPTKGQTVYVEELWVQKNVHLNIERRVQRGNHLLLALILLMTVVYTYNASEMWIWQRAKRWAILRAVGWRGSTLVAYLLRLGVLVGSLAGGIGLLVGWGIQLALGLQVPGQAILWIAPLSILLLLMGMLLPAWRMGRMPLSNLLLERTIYRPPRRPLVWILARHRQQALAGLVVVSGASLLLTVVIGGLLSTHGYLQLTLLGQYLLVRLQGYHWLIAALGGYLSGLAVLDIGLLAVQRNRVMAGVFQAVGWRTRHILAFWVRQGTALGLLGGMLGSLLAVALLTISAGQWDVGYGLAALASVIFCTALSAAASLWPAYIAARYPVVEVLKEA